MFKRVYRDREETVRLVNELLAEGAPRARATVLRLKRGRETSLTGFGVKRQMVNITCEMDAVVARVLAHGAELIGEVVQYEDTYRLAYIRGPEGVIVGLNQQIG